MNTKQQHFTLSLKLYTTGEFISNDILFEKKKKTFIHTVIETLHNWRIYK